MPNPFFMNSYLGKQILSLVREGDFAHAGEEEAIAVSMAPVPKDADQLILDAGCGRGGTAAYMQELGWGSVVGIDIEPNSIAYADATYPEPEFLRCDINAVATLPEGPFDVITLFNVFYALPDHVAALESLASRAKPEAQVVIFDYVDPGRYQEDPLMDRDIAFLPNPPRLDDLPKTMERGGWQLDTVRDLTPDYVRWYGELVDKIAAKREGIVELAGEDIYAHVLGLYSALLAALREGRLGGAVIYARRADA